MSRYYNISACIFAVLLLLISPWQTQAQECDFLGIEKIMGAPPKIVWGGCDVAGKAAAVPAHMGDCAQPIMLDLFSIMGVSISPSHGYWGDSRGIARKDKNLVDSRNYDFSSTREIVDTFYFFITNGSGIESYCGLNSGDYLALVVRFSGYCDNKDDEFLRFNFAFCQNTAHENIYDLDVNKPLDIANLLGSFINKTVSQIDERNKFLNSDGSLNPDWKINFYADSLASIRVAAADSITYMDLNTVGKRTIFWIRLENIKTRERIKIKKTEIIVYPQPVLNITYTPDIRDRYREYDVDDEITITVQNKDVFDTIQYYLNNKYLNKYFMGGETDPKNGAGLIKLSALVFTGAEDIVRINARDTNKCFIDTAMNVVINVPLPNVFTPDGDGVNDIFFGGEKFADREFHLEILNRWGNLLYKGSNGWDGTYNGAEVPPGTYYYALHLKSPDGTTKIYKGSVTLVRNRR